MADVSLPGAIDAVISRNRSNVYLSLMSLCVIGLVVVYAVWRARTEAGTDSLAVALVRSFLAGGATSILVAWLTAWMVLKCDAASVSQASAEVAGVALAVCIPLFMLLIDSDLFFNTDDYFDLASDRSDSRRYEELTRIVVVLGVTLGAAYAWLFNALQDKRRGAATLTMLVPFATINTWYLLRRHEGDSVGGKHIDLLVAGLVIPLAAATLSLRLS